MRCSTPVCHSRPPPITSSAIRPTGRSHFRPIGVELAHSRTAGLAWAGKEARGDSMSAIDDAQQANARFAQEFRLGQLPVRPAKKLAIVACMDARLTIEPALGLKAGDAHIIRNAGGIVTEDAIRSLLISRSEEHTSELQSLAYLVCRLLLEKKKQPTSKRPRRVLAEGRNARRPPTGVWLDYPQRAVADPAV